MTNAELEEYIAKHQAFPSFMEQKLSQCFDELKVPCSVNAKGTHGGR